MTDHDRSDESPDGGVRHETPSGPAAALLHAPLADAQPPERRRGFPLKTLLVSAFVAYHALGLIVHNLPDSGLTKDFRYSYMGKLDFSRYMQATSIGQSWPMFAPNPPRHNQFMRIMVEEKNGDLWDIAHDHYGRRTYPYLVYSRMGKINRRLFKMSRHRESYGAWACREWERTHGGESAKEIRFIKMWTRIPPPELVYERMHYDPMELELQKYEILKVPCATTIHAQLPPYLRERYGLPPAPQDTFVKLETYSWIDIARMRDRIDRGEIMAARRERLRRLEEETDPGMEDTGQ